MGDARDLRSYSICAVVLRAAPSTHHQATCIRPWYMVQKPASHHHPAIVRPARIQRESEGPSRGTRSEDRVVLGPRETERAHSDAVCLAPSVVSTLSDPATTDPAEYVTRAPALGS